MKCPLLVAAQNALGRPQSKKELECGKEECAWWVDAFNKCTIRELRDYLEAIDNHLHEINKKMPHAGQFTK